MRHVQLEGGHAINGDCTDHRVVDLIVSLVGDAAAMVITDPPYGKVLGVQWDKFADSDDRFVDWMIGWVNQYSVLVPRGGAMYVWGGLGRVHFRPFLKFLVRVEVETAFKVGNVITWAKRRAYGVQHNYLFCREELVYLYKGEDIKKPRTFNVPLLDEKRGYAGYDERYPAKSEFKRRTNVWTDVTELMCGKIHDAQKPLRTFEVPIQVHTSENEWVIDLFSGSGTAAWAAAGLGRRFIVVERDAETFDSFVERWGRGERPKR